MPREAGWRASYERQKGRARTRAAREVAAGQEIGPIPPVVDPIRRAAAIADLRTFCETYLARTFYLPWSKNQLTVFPRIQQTVLHGGRAAIAMPRGEGKTSLAEAAVLWTVLPGRCRFVTFLGCTASNADDTMESLTTEFEENHLLLEDFPEVLFPIRCLERTPNRAAGQKHQARPTRITWGRHRKVLPMIVGSRASGTILTTTGLEGGRVRGQRHKLPTGETIRPDLFLLDDPQNDDTAWSVQETRKRIAAIEACVLGAAGPRRPLGAILCCTVIRPEDLAEEFTDPGRRPDWHGLRLPMVHSFPRNAKAWDRYAKVLADDMRAGGNGSKATAHYRDRQAALDAGAVVSWPDRFDPWEASGIQHAMDIRFAAETTFWAEFQNAPKPDEEAVEHLRPEDILARTNALPRRAVPADAEHITAFIDVQARLLYYAVVAWTRDFTGAVVDYGTYPDQRRARFTYRDAKTTLTRRHRGIPAEEAIRIGIETIAGELAGRTWRRQDGAGLRIERLLVDRGYEPRIIELACRRLGEPAMPYLGRGIPARRRPISTYLRKPGRRLGFFWWIPAPRESQEDRHVLADVNFWKSFVRARLTGPIAGSGSLTIWGRATRHQMLADHLTSERGTALKGPYGTVEEWDLIPGRPDNHLLDCLVGCAVAASMLGCTLAGTEAPRLPTRRKAIRLSDIQRSRA